MADNDLIERLRMEAQIHAQEARTANATIAEIYQLCSGGKGEPGNWHGAEPVRALIAERDALAATLRQQAGRVEYPECSGNPADCPENEGYGCCKPNPSAQGEAVADAWTEGYRQGVTDERTSAANIGIAGFDAKVEPARENPYRKHLHAERARVPDGVREKEAIKLAGILDGMTEGGYTLDGLYERDQADGDCFVARAADLLREFAAPSQRAEVKP